MKRVNWGITLSIAACVLVAPAAFAQFESDFDSLAASADGTILTGQGTPAYYLPVNPGSTDFEVYTYSANTLRLPQNPTGGTQFIAGVGQADGNFERAQKDMVYGAGTGTWTAAFDIAATYTGQLPTAQNIGSFSIQPFPGSQSFIALARWDDVATAAEWNADYVWFDVNGAQLTESVPNPDFQNLAIDHWYRWATTFSLDTNQILEVSLTDLTTGDVFTHNPADRWLEGGSGGSATPTGFRFFAGSSTAAGNVLGFDNISIVPEPTTLVLLGLGGLALIRRR